MSQANQQQPPAALKALDMFVGIWLVTGANLEGAPAGAGAPVRGEVSYEWLRGGHYLICNWDRRFEGGEHIGIGIISYDGERGQFRADNYDNMGNHRTYILTREDYAWHFDSASERATLEFNRVDRSFTEYWEINDQGDWKPLCRLQGVIAQ